MYNEYSIDFNEKVITAEYVIEDDIVTVYLPNGDIRETKLNGLKPESAVRVHLTAYAKKTEK